MTTGPHRSRHSGGRNTSTFATPRGPRPGVDARRRLPGLAYFDPDPAYRFVVPLHEHDEKETVTVETTADGEQTYRRWGVSARNRRRDRNAAGVSPHRRRRPLLAPLPRRDERRRRRTARAVPRFEPDRDRVDGEWVVDCNVAYNPTCAYNHAYECPLIPMENWLDVAIEAGEKKFPCRARGCRPLTRSGSASKVVRAETRCPGAVDQPVEPALRVFARIRAWMTTHINHESEPAYERFVRDHR